MKVFLLGGTGTIGRATLTALVNAGHQVVGFGRNQPVFTLPACVEWCVGDVTQPASVDAALADQTFDAVVSCLASRTGAPLDAWAVDYNAHLAVLNAAVKVGIKRFVLLSAICVQKPTLPFQQAKLAFEEKLRASDLTWSIIRPTAFFKSLSGQIKRVQQGKPYLLFGDGALTACKPISDRDLAMFIAGCLTEPGRANQVLPIGGPGPALTPLQQAQILFEVLGIEPRFRNVPVALMDTIVSGLSLLGRVSKGMAAKAELARIGRYYATESMLVLDPDSGRYDADATPETGTDTLRAHFEAVIRGDVAVDLGDHAVF